jgi:DNA end-binding protein Ku
VKKKAAGHTIEPREEPEEGSNVINLMDALKQSIKGRGGGKTTHSTKRKPTGRKRKAS